MGFLTKNHLRYNCERKGKKTTNWLGGEGKGKGMATGKYPHPLSPPMSSTPAPYKVSGKTTREKLFRTYSYKTWIIHSPDTLYTKATPIMPFHSQKNPLLPSYLWMWWIIGHIQEGGKEKSNPYPPNLSLLLLLLRHFPPHLKGEQQYLRRPCWRK